MEANFLTNWDQIDDFNDQVNREIASYEVRDVILNPDHLLADDFVIQHLDWRSIKFDRDEMEKVPDDKRGVYGFAIGVDSDVLPPHGYILYIGIAGRNSDRPLRERCRDYLTPSKVIKRRRIKRAMNWRRVLRLIFAPVDDTVPTEDIEALEIQLNTALISPFAEQDMEADLREKRGAWR